MGASGEALLIPVEWWWKSWLSTRFPLNHPGGSGDGGKEGCSLLPGESPGLHMASAGRPHRDEVLDPCSVGLLHIPGWREEYPRFPGAGGGLGSPVYLCWFEWNHSFLLWWLSRAVTDGGFLSCRAAPFLDFWPEKERAGFMPGLLLSVPLQWVLLWAPGYLVCLLPSFRVAVCLSM